MVEIVCGPVQLFLKWYNFFVPVQNLLNGSHYTFLQIVLVYRSLG